MKTMSLNRELLATMLACSAGCATIVNPSTQPVTIVSDPPAAEVIVDSEGIGSTPTDVLLSRGDSEAAVRLQKHWRPISTWTASMAGRLTARCRRKVDRQANDYWSRDRIPVESQR